MFLLLSLIGAVALAVSPAQVFAGDCVAPISWGTTYAYESDYANYESNPGSELKLVGTVNCFNGMFDDIDPNAGTEYSVYVFGLISQGTVVTVAPPMIGLTSYETRYEEGTVQIWEDPTPDAVFTPNPENADVPSTFNNGTLFLEGNLEGLDVTFFLVTATNEWNSGNFDSDWPAGAVWTGGSGFERVNLGGGCPLRLTGGWNTRPTAHPAGYTADVEGKIDIDCPTQGDDSSWGQLKGLYR
jgi:hypothetical protein